MGLGGALSGRRSVDQTRRKALFRLYWSVVPSVVSAAEGASAARVHVAPLFWAPCRVGHPERCVESRHSAVRSCQSSVYPESRLYVDSVSQFTLSPSPLGVHNVCSLHLCLFHR